MGRVREGAGDFLEEASGKGAIILFPRASPTEFYNGRGLPSDSLSVNG